MTPLGTLPGSTGARALGINNHAQVVGNTDFDAFLWQRGRLTALPHLVSTSSAADINNRGQVVGIAKTARRGIHLDCTPTFLRTGSRCRNKPLTWGFDGAAGRTRTDDLLITKTPRPRSQRSEQHPAHNWPRQDDATNRANRIRVPRPVPRGPSGSGYVRCLAPEKISWVP